MEKKEKIKVYIRYKNGWTACICKRNPDTVPCNNFCEPDIVERDKFRGWQECFRQNKYGKDIH